MARRTDTVPLKYHSILKCQVRLAAAKTGIRIQVTSGPGTPAFTGVRIWPDPADSARELVLKAGPTVVANFQIEPEEDFWIEIAYGSGKNRTVQIKYEHRKPFGYKATKVINNAKVDLIGSVPRIRMA